MMKEEMLLLAHLCWELVVIALLLTWRLVTVLWRLLFCIFYFCISLPIWTMCKCCMKEDKWKYLHTSVLHLNKNCSFALEKGQKLACTSECYAAIEINGITCCVDRTLSSVGGLCAVRKGFKSLQPHYVWDSTQAQLCLEVTTLD